MKKKRYPYDIRYPLPFMELGGVMKPLDMSSTYLPKGGSMMNPVKNPSVLGHYGLSSSKIQSAVDTGLNLAGNAMNVLAGNNHATIAPDSATQQTFDSIANLIPFYSVGDAIGNYAAKDYKNINMNPENPETFGKLTDPAKYDVASTIGGFLGPDNLISGLSGDGWTAGQRRKKMEAKLAPQRNVLIAQKDAEIKQREINAGNQGRYWDQNNLMQAELGGPLTPDGTATNARIALQQKLNAERDIRLGDKGNYNYAYAEYPAPVIDHGILDHVLEQRRQEALPSGSVGIGTPGSALGIMPTGPACLGEGCKRSAGIKSLDTNPVKRAMLKQQAFGGSLPVIGESYEDGGQLPQITQYNVGGQHSENPNGGIPVDQSGNRVSASKAKPVATTEEGEMSWMNPATGQAYVFSNKIIFKK